MDSKSDPHPSTLDERYGRIVRRATEAFLLNGYAATAVEDIAIDASVSKPTIYRIFKDKYGLVTAVVQEILDGLERDSRKSIDFDANIEDCLVKFADNYIFWAKKRIGMTNNFSLIKLLMEMSGQYPDFATTWVERSRTSIVGPLAEYMADRIKRGDLAEEDPYFMASQFMKCMYQSYQSVLIENVYNDTSMTRRKVRLFLRGVATEAYRTGEGRE